MADQDLGLPAPGAAAVSRGRLPLLAAMRPKQWIKNLIVFAGFVFTLNERWRPFSSEMWRYLALSTAAFLVFCLVSSSVYLLNDVKDVEKDRQHPKKRRRPIAAGTLSARVAIAAGLSFMPIALVAGYLVSPGFGAVVAGYVLMQLAYTFYLKHIVLVDVFVIAIGFVMRAISGALALGVDISPWLYIVTLLGSLFMAFCKRRNELLLLDSEAASHRKILESYTPSLLDSLTSIVASATIMAYSLYTFTSPKLPPNHLMMVTIPFVIFGMFRYLYLAHSHDEGGSPEEVFFKDRPLIATIAAWIITTGLILALR